MHKSKNCRNKTKLFIYFFGIFVLLFANLPMCFSQPVLKGGISVLVKKGELLNVVLSSQLNFYFSQIGDTVVCFTGKDIDLGNGIYIPQGSRVEGIVSKINQPKNFGRNGSFEITFNKIITPEKISLPVYASVTTDITEAAEKVADVLTYDSALIAYGTFHGALAGIQYGGIPLAVASHGISVLAGAGLGAGAGILGSAVRKGMLPTVIPGTNVPLTLKSDFVFFGQLSEDLSVQKSKEPKKERFKGFRFFPQLKESDLKIVIKDVDKKHSENYGNYTTINFQIVNNSEQSISLTNIVLINSLTSEIFHPDLFLAGNDVLKNVKPYDEINASLSFLTGDLKNSYLAVIDPLDGKEIVKIPLR